MGLGKAGLTLSVHGQQANGLAGHSSAQDRANCSDLFGVYLLGLKGCTGVGLLHHSLLLHVDLVGRCVVVEYLTNIGVGSRLLSPYVSYMLGLDLLTLVVCLLLGTLRLNCCLLLGESSLLTGLGNTCSGADSTD